MHCSPFPETQASLQIDPVRSHQYLSVKITYALIGFGFLYAFLILHLFTQKFDQLCGFSSTFKL